MQPLKKQRTDGDIAVHLGTDMDRNEQRDTKLRASAACVCEGQPASAVTSAEAKQYWQNGHMRADHWQTALEAAGGNLAWELLDFVHDTSPRTEELR